MTHDNQALHSLDTSIRRDSKTLAEPLDPTRIESKDDLMKQFMREFSFKIATTQEDKEKALSLRHDVFIKELGYKMTDIENTELESDEYDASSVHCILIHKGSGRTAGCFRIVTTRTPGQDGFSKLPVEEHGNEGISHPNLHPSMFPREHVCEASRLAISKCFRHSSSQDDSHNSTPEPVVEPKGSEDTYPLILVSLFLAAYSLAEILGNRHLYAMMSPTLPRLLRKSGFDFVRLGDTIEFHGKRNVFYINRSLAVSGMQHALYPLHHYIYQELESQFAECSDTNILSCSS